MSIFNNLKNDIAPAVGEVENLVHHPIYRTPWYVSVVVDGKLWRGSWPDAVPLKMLKSGGVVASLNFCSERQQDDLIRSFGIVPYNIPVEDNTAPTDADLEKAVDIFDWVTVPANPMMPGGILFAHCEQGIGRTGCFIAGIRVKRCGWTPQQALDEAMHYGLSLESQKAFIMGLKA